ncbi:MAG: tetratricopeptide repeat protein [Promethearchaeota archaeon]
MSIFYFRTLILGSDPDAIHFYISRAFGEPGEDKETYVSWYKEIKVLDNVCDLEIDALISVSADLDEIIPMVDGIIYFINPTVQEESELFEMILPDIFSVKRDIPTIIVFYDQNGILPISVNDLLTHIWVNFPSLEAYINLSPNDFHQVLQSLCLAIINGDTPLNIENAWMRFPIFIQMANIYFNNQNYYYAAQAIRKAAQIADIYNKEEFFIISEQAAYLYSKMNLYLEASNILEKVDRQKSVNFKKLYAEAMIREANLFFKRNEYEKAAKRYERAAQWSSIEFLDKKLINEAFSLAINSWISACRVEDAFRILNSLPQQEVIIILKEISNKIGAAADYLVSTNNYELAREQLYKAVNRYQLEDLFDELKDLTNKLTEVLIKLLKLQVSELKNHAARNTYDEIENMWTSYKVKRVNLDSTLEDLINQFFEVNNFRMATIIIDKLTSRKLKQQLAKVRDELEDKYISLKKKEVEDYINKGIQVIKSFAEVEQEIIIEMNSQKITEANEFIKQNSYLTAANLLKKQAEYLRSIGKDEIRDQIITKSLDVLLDGLEFENFFISFNELSVDMKTKYLIRIFPKFIQKLHELTEIEDYERIDKTFDNSNKIYRNQMLYDQSKEISLLFIKVIKREALEILESEDNLSAVNRVEFLIKKVLNIASAYLEKEENIKITFNKIYKRITEIYIELDNLHLAHVYNDKIEKPAYKIELHKKIEMLEAKKSKIRAKKAKETRKGEELKEKDSIIEKRAQEARIDKENDMKERKGLKRGYFKDGLSFLTTQQYEEALEIYKNTMKRLNLTKKYKLAGISLAIASLILMNQNKFEDAKTLLEKTKKELSGLGKLFSEAFAVTLIEYVIDLKSFQDEKKFKEALDYFKDLPLFEEELRLLSELRGEEYQEEEKSETTVEMLTKQKEILEGEIKEMLSREEYGKYSKLLIEFEQSFAKLQAKSVDARRDKEIILKKRTPMRKRYYSPILELLESQKFREGAKKYLELAYTFAKRKDLEISSLMVILHGLTLLKAGDPLKLIKNNIEVYLDSLGINKKLAEETFYIMLLLFLIDIKLYNFDKFLPKIKEMLEIIPLFEEEKILL